MLYRISCHDNGIFFFDEGTFSRCTKCNELTDKWNEDLTTVKVSKRVKADISCSYDGVVLVSNRFKNVVETNGLIGLSFRQINKELFWILPNETIHFDKNREGLRFEGRCSQCGNYESIVPANPVVLLEREIRNGNFARTDLEFASNDEKHPLIICDESAQSILKKARLKGLVFKEVEQSFH